MRYADTCLIYVLCIGFVLFSPPYSPNSPSFVLIHFAFCRFVIDLTWVSLGSLQGRREPGNAGLFLAENMKRVETNDAER
jgi:hypothetical protein